MRTVEPVFDTALGSQRVFFKLPASADLPVGLTGVLRWQGNQRKLPPRFLVRQGPELGVIIQKDGKPLFIAVPGSVEGLPFTLALPTDTKVIRP